MCTLKGPCVNICNNLDVLITFLLAIPEQIIMVNKKLDLPCLSSAYAGMCTICLSSLMLLTCGFIYEGLRSDFPRQSKRCVVIHVFGCLVSVL